MIPLHALVLILMGRFSDRLYVAYSSWYAIGTLASMQVPFVGFQPVSTSEHMGALGMEFWIWAITRNPHIQLLQASLACFKLLLSDNSYELTFLLNNSENSFSCLSSQLVYSGLVPLFSLLTRVKLRLGRVDSTRFGILDMPRSKYILFGFFFW